MKIACVVGARPNFIKIAPFLNELKKNPIFTPVLIHTGQHYDNNLSYDIFQDLELPEPDINLEVNSSDFYDLYSACYNCFRVCAPDRIAVVGDVTSSAAAAQAAYHLSIPIAHIEAGLRSFDNTMPEEWNRIHIDKVSDLYFVTEIAAVNNLLNEGYPASKIHLVGNLMIDSLYQNLQKIKNIPKRAVSFALLTIHRESNTDKNSLRRIMNSVCQVADKIKVVFPVHPRTFKNLEINHPNIEVREPMGYLEFLSAMISCKFVMTDSGGIQDETTALGIPCLTLRENTERPCTLAGTSRLVGKNPFPAALEILNEYTRLEIKPPLWDGKTAPRVVKILEQWI